jgi:hypothetical protein
MTMTRKEAIDVRGRLASESAKAYRIRKQLEQITDSKPLHYPVRQAIGFLRDREVAARAESDAISELLGLQKLRK